MAELSELDGDERNKKMLRLSIIAELDAANLYEQMANMSDNSNIKKVMLDVAKEEKVHAGEFESLLKKLDPEHEPSTEEGEKEVDEMTGEED
jgi:rubrerythrin